jgi:hypothetical protein
MALDAEYRDYFIRNLHDALSGHTSNNVQEAVEYSERSRTKCIGITIETRPDYCLRPHLNSMLDYGCTRLEIGVQSVYEDVARDTNRCGPSCRHGAPHTRLPSFPALPLPLFPRPQPDQPYFGADCWPLVAGVAAGTRCGPSVNPSMAPRMLASRWWPT